MKIGTNMGLKYVYSGTCLANKKFMQKIEKILRVSRSDKAKYRVQVLEFHEKYGTEATKDAFGVGKRQSMNGERNIFMQKKMQAYSFQNRLGQKMCD